MDFAIPEEIQQTLRDLDDFIELEIRPLQAQDDNERFFDHRREWARTDFENDGVPRADWEELLREMRRRADVAGWLRLALPPEFGGRSASNLEMAIIREHLATKGLGLFNDLQNESSVVGNFPTVLMMRDFGTEEQKQLYLQPLLDGEIFSCYSMTEPQAGADPGQFTCQAELQGNEWVINGEKWFASHACVAEFLIVMCITDPEVPVHEGSTMLIVPRGTPGMEIIRNTAVGPKDVLGSGVHGYLRFSDCRVPMKNVLVRCSLKLGPNPRHSRLRASAGCPGSAVAGWWHCRR